jgi:lipopolysaccharide transport system permease protein
MTQITAQPSAETIAADAVPAVAAAHAGSAAFRATGREAEMLLLSHLRYRDRWALAWGDLAEGFRLRGLWRTLAWLDIKTRYRGSVLGPFWLTLSTAVMVGTLGLLYAELFHINVHSFLPFIALSLVLWNFLAMLVTDGCTVFTVAEGTIRSMRMPFFVFAGQSVYRNILILGHNIIVIVVVFAVLRIAPGMVALAAIPGLVLWLVDAFAFTMLLGAFCARFRDVPPIVASVLQIAFYVTPIIWKPDLLPVAQRKYLVFDPFFALFDIVRAPMLGAWPSDNSWLAACLFSVVLCVVAWLSFVRVRSRIAFWI